MKEILISKGFSCQVDDDLYEYLNQFKWHAKIGHGTIYVNRATSKRTGKRKLLAMHTEVVGIVGSGYMVDHIDGNGLNNQRHNLRVVSMSQNQMNSRKRKADTTSKYKGVSYRKDRGCWVSEIMANGVRIRKSGFATEDLAALNYNELAKVLHGQFASLNAVEN